MTTVAAAMGEKQRQNIGFLDDDGSNITGNSSRRHQQTTMTGNRNGRGPAKAAMTAKTATARMTDGREGSNSNGSTSVDAAKALMQQRHQCSKGVKAAKASME